MSWFSSELNEVRPKGIIYPLRKYCSATTWHTIRRNLTVASCRDSLGTKTWRRARRIISNYLFKPRCTLSWWISRQRKSNSPFSSFFRSSYYRLLMPTNVSQIFKLNQRLEIREKLNTAAFLDFVNINITYTGYNIRPLLYFVRMFRSTRDQKGSSYGTIYCLQNWSLNIPSTFKFQIT